MKQYLVMMIDDDLLTIKFNTMVVKKNHPEAELVTFISAQDALEYLQTVTNQLPDIIFLDLNMPVMNGWDFMDEFKKLNLDIEVVVLTSSSEKEDIDKSVQSYGIDKYFVKPLSLDAVKTMFRSIFSK